MCGRYVLKASKVELSKQFHLDEVPQWSARYNIAPLQAAPIIHSAAPKRLVLAQWGLLPHWAKDPKIAHTLINARAETIEQKSVFRELVGTHRCVVPADGFYEWRHEGRQRLPHFVHRTDGALLAMAGLWSRWRSPDGLDVDTFTIITTAANSDVKELHERMPVLLSGEGLGLWLSDTKDHRAVEALLVTPPGKQLLLTPVSSHVNSVNVDDPRCLEPPTTIQLRLL
jgi:putative SOS response-associated peptidase YedK